MKIKRLECRNYRNIEFAEIFPDDCMNVICGENAQGKTNLIEAIWLFSGAKSFRNTKDSQPVKFGEKKAVCRLDFESGSVLNNAVMEFTDKRTAFLNDKALSNPSKLAGVFNAVVFSPVDLGLVKEGPAVRRRFLDIAIGQLYSGYINTLQEYTRAVKQRNEIIKDYKYDSTVSVMLDIFEDEISSKGLKIIEYRKRYIEIIKKFLPEIYEGLSSGREILETEYLLSCEPENLRQRLIDSRKEDIYSGITSVGPHRDDLVFKLNGINARIYGSQGQQRSIALSLKLAQAQVIKDIMGEYPVCLLDDVMSELDPRRQGYILNHIRGWQSFLTCCDPSNIEGLQNGKIIRVNKGVVT